MILLRKVKVVAKISRRAVLQAATSLNDADA
jgi:hypothetical protein